MTPKDAARRRYNTYPVSQPGSGLNPSLAYPEVLHVSLLVVMAFVSSLQPDEKYNVTTLL